MPELPEVETTRQYLLPQIMHQKITGIIVREKRLRWPVTKQLIDALPQSTINAVNRRAKYLLIETDKGTLIVHLGMSGHLQILPYATAPSKHDHIDLQFENGKIVRFNDPRRFGAWLWTTQNPTLHPRLACLGPEPLTPDFNGDYLYQTASGKQRNIKAFLMDHHVVVGVGNIYVAETLFAANIHPMMPVNQLNLAQWHHVARMIKNILRFAIQSKGTTLRDFRYGEGASGAFKEQLTVYGRQGLACKKCTTILQRLKTANRSVVFCPQCQKLAC